MTKEQWAKLTDEEKRIKVAELCGWAFDTGTDYKLPCCWGIWPSMREGEECQGVGTKGYAYEIPNYHQDLNAMHEVVGTLTEQQKTIYRNLLVGMCDGMCNNWGAIDATAAQRAEAFVLALTMESEDE